MGTELSQKLSFYIKNLRLDLAFYYFIPSVYYKKQGNPFIEKTQVNLDAFLCCTNRSRYSF